MTRFDELVATLTDDVRALEPRRRAVFLLAYAERLSKVFALFEARAGEREQSFERVLDATWRLAEGARDDELGAIDFDTLIPGEDWVVDGFHDALAQDIGGLAEEALRGLSTGAMNADDGYGAAAFEVIRGLLCEMRLGCTEPGDSAAGRRFEDELDRDPLVAQEAAFWRELFAKVRDGIDAAELRTFARSHHLEPDTLEPDLSAGLAKDTLEAQAWLDSPRPPASKP